MRSDIAIVLKQFVKFSNGNLSQTRVDTDVFESACRSILPGNLMETIDAMKVAGLLLIHELPDWQGGASYYQLTGRGLAELRKIYDVFQDEERLVSITDFQNKLWHSFDLIRGSVSAQEFHFIFYLLFLQRYQVLDDLTLISPTEVKDRFRFTVQKSFGHFPDEFRDVSNFYIPLIERVDNRVLYNLLRLLRDLNQPFLKENFNTIFETLLYRYVSFQGRVSGEFILPLELSRFVTALGNPAMTAKVYNPFAGLASFGVHLNDGPEYFGQEINSSIWALGTLRLLSHNRKGKSVLSLGDSLNNWNPRLYSNLTRVEDIFQINSSTQKFELIISNPPLGGRIGPNNHGQFGYIKTYEQFFIEQGLRDLSTDGKLVAVLSQGFLSRQGVEYNMRQYLIEQDILETVISFPGGLLINTGVAVTVLVINMQKAQKGSIHFVDAKGFMAANSPREKRLNDEALLSAIRNSQESNFLRIASIETVKSYDYNLTVARYFQKQYDGVPLAEIGKLIKGQRPADGQIGKVVRIRDLKDDALDSQLALATLEDTEVPRLHQSITESCILMASRWRTLKPTYFEYKGTPVFISVDTFAFKVDETKCNILYLLNELHSNYVTEQLDSLRSGASVIPTIKREDLLSVVISLPDLNSQHSLDKQKAIVKERLIALASEKKRELTLFNKIHGLEAEIFEQNTYLRHTLAGPASNLKDSISSINRIIKEKIAISHPELLNLKVSEKHLISLGEYLEIIDRDANKIVKAVSSQLKVDTGIDSKKLSPIEIIGFLENYSKEYNDRSELNFSVNFEFDEEVFVDNGLRVKTFILGNDELLRDLFDNLIENARRHAFGEGNKNRIEIFIMKNSELEDDVEVQVLVSNTGKPFPEDFTINEFIRKGSKYGDNAGDGFGGWYINEIVKRLNGDFDIIDETSGEGLPGSDLATSFEINFPIIDIEENV